MPEGEKKLSQVPRDQIVHYNISPHVNPSALLNRKVEDQVTIGQFDNFFTVSIQIGKGGGEIEWFFRTDEWFDVQKNNWTEEVRARVAEIFRVVAEKVAAGEKYPPSYWQDEDEKEGA